MAKIFTSADMAIEPMSHDNKDKGEKSTLDPACIRMENISDSYSEAVLKQNEVKMEDISGSEADTIVLTDGRRGRDSRPACSKRVKEEKYWLSLIAVIKIQRSCRAYLLRRLRALQAYQELALVETKLGEIRFLFNDIFYRHRVARDAEECQRFAEKIIVLLLTVDAIEVTNVMIRSFKKSMLDELEAMLDVVDNRGNSEKKFTPSMKPMLEEKVEETTDHGFVLLKQAFLKRKSQALQAHRDLAMVGTKLKEIKSLFNEFSYCYRVARDAEERQIFAEKIIVLILPL